MIVSRKVYEQRVHEQFEWYVETIVNELKEADDVAEWIEKNVLDVSRKQSLRPDGWVTEYYELLLVWGGPGVWLRTNGVIVLSWSGDYLEVKVQDEKFLEKLVEIEAYFEEVK